MLSYSPTTTQEISLPVLAANGISLVVKREDLNHPAVSGNKWWKLKYNLQEARRQGFDALLTFGGAYSNHVYATAAAAAAEGFRSFGVIRGEEPKQLNPTLQFVRSCGMHLHFVSREVYRDKADPNFVDSLRKRFGDFYLIPEGGSNPLAVKGCAEFAEQHLSALEFDNLFLAVGTGGTIAGLICGLPGSRKITGVPVLKNGSFLEREISALVSAFRNNGSTEWSLLTDYHHGGYAKTTPALLDFIIEMRRFGLPLDHVYTAKVLWAILREVESGNVKRGTRILMLHTGGLQGSIKGP